MYHSILGSRSYGTTLGAVVGRLESIRCTIQSSVVEVRGPLWELLSGGWSLLDVPFNPR